MTKAKQRMKREAHLCHGMSVVLIRVDQFVFLVTRAVTYPLALGRRRTCSPSGRTLNLSENTIFGGPLRTRLREVILLLLSFLLLLLLPLLRLLHRSGGGSGEPLLLSGFLSDDVLELHGAAWVVGAVGQVGANHFARRA